MDSNQKFIDQRKLWTINGTSWNVCSRISNVDRLFEVNKYSELEYVLISTGVNDIDYFPGCIVHDKIIKVVNVIKGKCPNIKIIVSHVTPRKDELHAEVKICNEMMNKSISRLDNVFLVIHENLNYSMLYDNKHIKKESIRHFARNIKVALRKAYGMRPISNDIVRDRVNTDVTNNIDARMKYLAGYGGPSNKQEVLNQIIDSLKALLM